MTTKALVSTASDGGRRHDAVLVEQRREDAERLVDVARRLARPVVEELEQRGHVLGRQVDVARLERAEQQVAEAAELLDLDLVAGVVEALRVDLGEDRRLAEVLGADRDRRAVGDVGGAAAPSSSVAVSSSSSPQAAAPSRLRASTPASSLVCRCMVPSFPRCPGLSLDERSLVRSGRGSDADGCVVEPVGRHGDVVGAAGGSAPRHQPALGQGERASVSSASSATATAPVSSLPSSGLAEPLTMGVPRSP